MYVIIRVMKRIAVLVLIILFSFAGIASSADYRVLVIPDSVANKPCLDSFIYEESAEFFANQVINKLNLSGTIESITVSEVRDKLSKNPRLNIATRNSLTRFKKEYNIDYLNAKKLAQMFDVNRILFITTSADSQNYFMRRTFWDFLNIPGATVIDPAIKLSTYAVLIDTDRNIALWEDTFYKTISACENRMVANSLEPQTQQLEKIKDYSKMLGAQIANNVQVVIVPKNMLNRSNKVEYGPKDFDNVFTKKYRWYKHGAKEITTDTKRKYNDSKQRRLDKKALKEKQEAEELERIRIKLQQDKLKLEETKNKEIKNVNEQKPQLEIRDVVKKTEQPEPVKAKEINVEKNEYVPVSVDSENESSLKYYQQKPRMMQRVKNTTINDI